MALGKELKIWSPSSLHSNYNVCDLVRLISLNHSFFICKMDITDSQEIKLDNRDVVPGTYRYINI